MICFGSVYLIAKDFEKSVDFYKRLFQKDVAAQNRNRFAIFTVENLCLSIMNACFDRDNPDKVEHRGKSYSQYDDMEEIALRSNCGKVVINLASDDLAKEYGRIQKLGIGEDMTEIRYVNAGTPYYYFSMKDPDENTIEITGTYDAELYF